MTIWTPDRSIISTADARETERRSAMIEAVKKSAADRIEAIMPDYAQRNHLALFAETAMQHGVDPSKWPQEQRSINTAAVAKWQQIKRLRARSNEIEAMIGRGETVDINDDKTWNPDK